MTKRVRMAILGFAHGHVNSYCEMWLKHPEYKVDIVAGWDHDALRLETARAAYNLEFGQVFMVRRRHGLSMGLNADFANSWHVDPQYNRDIWADDCAHPVDFLHWLLGVPDTITAEIESLFIKEK